MKQRRVWPVIVAAGVFAALSGAWAAPGDPATPAPATPAPPAADQSTHVRGRVTAVDTDAKTVTLTVGRDQTATTLKVNDATKYLVDTPGTMADLKVGQNVRAMGQTDDTAHTVTARFVEVLPASEATPPAAGGRRFGVQGVIATLTPSLTITTADKTTDTVTTDANTQVTTPKDGKLSDVKADTFVDATTTGTGDTQVATTIHVMAFGRGGRRGGQAPAGGAAPATPPAPAAGQ